MITKKVVFPTYKNSAFLLTPRWIYLKGSSLFLVVHYYVFVPTIEGQKVRSWNYYSIAT